MPSWINQINDATILSDMRIASAMGVVSEQSMAKLFSDLAAKLSASNSALSASQMADLKLIASDLSVDESVSSYVTYITGALVNGNLANANWRGGSATASYLGDLHIGSNSTQLYELIGKWFLGTDLPAISNISGVNTRNVTYSTANENIFGVSGPQLSDINQGSIGDCYLCAALAELAAFNPDVITSMITSNGNNTYGVRFYVNGTPEYVTVNNQLPNGGTFFQTGPSLWGALIEKAYAELQAGGDLTGGSTGYYGNSYATIGNGGYPWYTLEELTGTTQIVNLTPNYSHTSWSINYLSQSLYNYSSFTSISNATILDMLLTAIANGNDVLLASYTTTYDAKGYINLEARHAFSIYGYDGITGLLELRNPWGVASKQTWNTTFEVGLSTLLGAGDIITIDNLSGNSHLPAAVNSLAASANNLASSASVITVTDSANNVVSQLDALQANAKLLAISLTDSNPVLTISSATLQQDADALAKIIGTYAITVGDAGANHVNTAIYSDVIANYVVDLNVTGGVVHHTIANETPIMDVTLTNVERLSFSDTKLALDTATTQSAGETALLIGAVLPGQTALDVSHQALLGAVIGLFDQGNSLLTLSGVLMRLPIWDALTGHANATNSQIANYLLTNVLGTAPSQALLDFAATELNSEAGATQGTLLAWIAQSAQSQTHIGLVGIQAHGLAYV